MKDYRRALEGVRFWDAKVEEFFRQNGQPIVDCVLQNREEIIALCEWMEQEDIASYLEVGIWTGRLLKALHSIFKFDIAAGVDLGAAKRFDLEIDLDSQFRYFEGNSRSPIYQNWRSKLGKIDLTLIDTDQSYEGVMRDFEINSYFPHRYIAFVGIAGSDRTGKGVKRFWDELPGKKFEIIKPHPEISEEAANTFGIGVWTEG